MTCLSENANPGVLVMKSAENGTGLQGLPIPPEECALCRETIALRQACQQCQECLKSETNSSVPNQGCQLP